MRTLARFARSLAIVSAVCALAIGLALSDEGWWALVAVAVAAAPAVVLFLFSVALREVAEVPARIRNLPGTAAERAAEARRLANELDRSRASRVPARAWRLFRLVRDSRELLTPWAPVLALASVPFLLATAMSAVAVPIEVLVALVLLLTS